MDWKTISPIVGSIAPLAGSILGGLIPFPGGSLIGQKFGEIIAKQLGVAPTPQAVSDALAVASEETKRTAITAALDKARAEIDGFVAYERAILDAQVRNLADVNATIRVENESRVKFREHWFFTAWRPAFAWCFIAVWSAFGLMLTAVTAKAAWMSPDALTTLKDAWPLFAAYFGPGAAVLGVLIPSRSAEKVAAIQNSTPMPNAKPVEPLAPKPPLVVKPTGGIVSKPAGARD